METCEQTAILSYLRHVEELCRQADAAAVDPALADQVANIRLLSKQAKDELVRAAAKQMLRNVRGKIILYTAAPAPSPGF